MDIARAYELAKEQYAELGVDTEKALQILDSTPISIHCWQGDDVKGFEAGDGELTGGIVSTGEYPGRARNGEELRADLDMALSQIPGPSKVNVHAIYLEDHGIHADRDMIEPEHFSGWGDWAAEKGIGLDFNPTYFSHPKSADGYTLSSADEGVRNFWIEHGKRCRAIGEYMGSRTGKRCVINHWIPDGCKERPIDTLGPRQRLIDSYAQIFAIHHDPALVADAVESKLFGIGSEAYVVGSHEFYLAYVMAHPEILLTMDTGHFHPTEMVSAKITAVLPFVRELLLHVSRPIRWDSDHCVAFDDELTALMHELVRSNALKKTNIALDYFDGSINRIASWVIGTRNTRKALLQALLEPVDTLKKLELAGDSTARLALTEEYKTYPLGAVWDYYCAKNGMEPRAGWLELVRAYERDVTSKR